MRALLRQWLILSRLPKAPRKVDAGWLESTLGESGIEIHRRTIQRDLVALSRLFPIVCDETNKPYGWSWAPNASLPASGAPAFYGAEGRQSTVLALYAALEAARPVEIITSNGASHFLVPLGLVRREGNVVLVARTADGSRRMLDVSRITSAHTISPETTEGRRSGIRASARSSWNTDPSSSHEPTPANTTRGRKRTTRGPR